MKKVGILTINDDRNYGNRLQNYAVQETLNKYGVIVETIHNQKGDVGIKRLKKVFKSFVKKLLFFKKNCKRYNNFMKFNKKIRYSSIYIDEYNCSNKLNKKYDYFFFFFYQVWNPNFGRMSDIDFLLFSDRKKRNSIAASFGISNLPEELKDYYKLRLSEMNNISVREERGKEMIEELTGRKDVEVLVDPTMLLTSDEWNKVCKKPKQLSNLKKDKYILNYFLGGLSDKRKQEINRVALEYNCEIINILDKRDSFYSCGPSEFLYLEKNAFLICTDSFHSSVFAIIYNRPFVVFEREGKNKGLSSRIDTLLYKFKLGKRKFNGEKITAENLNNDYKESLEILEIERKKADIFIKKALDIEDNNNEK